MPTYKVVKKGFYGGIFYDPDGKRAMLTTDKPLKPIPKWLESTKSKKVKVEEEESFLDSSPSDTVETL